MAIVRVLLVLTALVGLLREWKSRVLTAPIRDGLPARVDGETLRTISDRVGSRFVEGSGIAPEHTRPAILRTAADRLVEGGGQCGDAAEAMGAVLDVMGVPFRILHVDVRGNGANHVMLEVQADDGRWLIFDPLRKRAFEHPATGQLLTLDEFRALPVEERLAIDARYVTQWPLHAPVKRTRIAPTESTFSGKALMIEPGGELGFGALLLAVATRKRQSATRASMART